MHVITGNVMQRQSQQETDASIAYQIMGIIIVGNTNK